MAKGRQSTLFETFADEFVPPACVGTLQPANEGRQVCDRAEVSCAVECHLAGDEQIGGGSCMEGRKVSGNHVRSCRTVMNLYRARHCQDFRLRYAYRPA